MLVVALFFTLEGVHGVAFGREFDTQNLFIGRWPRH